MQNIVDRAELILAVNVNPKAEMLRRMLAYWEEKRGDRLFPTRRDIDPVDFSYALGNIALVEVVGPRFRFRLDGANLAQSLNYDLTGTFVDELEPEEFRLSVASLYEETLRRKQPLHYFRTAELAQRRLSYEALCLPLSADGQNISMIFDLMAPITDTKDTRLPSFISLTGNLKHNISNRSLQLTNDLL